MRVYIWTHCSYIADMRTRAHRLHTGVKKCRCMRTHTWKLLTWAGVYIHRRHEDTCSHTHSVLEQECNPSSNSQQGHAPMLFLGGGLSTFHTLPSSQQSLQPRLFKPPNIDVDSMLPHPIPAGSSPSNPQSLTLIPTNPTPTFSHSGVCRRTTPKAPKCWASATGWT